MRAISQDLLDRLKESQQTVYNNANPSLKVLISRGLSKELFRVFTIENLESLGAIDASARRTVVENDPDLVYAVRISGGVADILSHALPYDPTTDWDTEFTIGAATDVAIEHDGAWERDYTTKRYNFVTGTVPWVFYIASGSLKAQLWEDVAIELATDVTRVVALRGWIPANGDVSSDQGLIVAYLKTDGKMYYRSYCMQESGEKAWEVEHEVTAFTGTITDLALFRTNDFRVGFAAVIADNVWWSVTTRNWAGMSIWPEQLTGALSDLLVTVTEVEYADIFEEEHINGSLGQLVMYVCPADFAVGDLAITLIERIDDKHGKIVFDYELIDAEGQQAKFTIGSNTCLSVAYGDTNYQLILEMETAMAEYSATSVTYTPGDNGIKINGGNANCTVPIETFTTNIPGMPPESIENLVGILGDLEVTVTQVDYSDAYEPDEHLTGTLNTLVVTITKVGDNPL